LATDSTGNSTLAEKFCTWHDLEYTFHHAVRTLIAIMDRITNQVALSIEQPKGNAPGVNANAGWIEQFAPSNTELNIMPQSQKVPMQRAIDSNGRV
jgi:hypothetical protein